MATEEQGRLPCTSLIGGGLFLPGNSEAIAGATNAAAFVAGIPTRDDIGSMAPTIVTIGARSSAP